MKHFILSGLILIAVTVLPVIAIQETIAKGSFLIEIEQDNQPVAITDNVCKLKKEPFTIVVKMQKMEGVLMHASFNNSTYTQVLSDKPVSKIAGFKGTGLKTKKGNPDKEIILSEYAPNYWFYESSKEHRFDKATSEKGWLICRREIANLYDVQASKLFELAAASQDLYLVFINADYDPEDARSGEYQRFPIKIEWL